LPALRRFVSYHFTTLADTVKPRAQYAQKNGICQQFFCSDIVLMNLTRFFDLSQMAPDFQTSSPPPSHNAKKH